MRISFNFNHNDYPYPGNNSYNILTDDKIATEIAKTDRGLVAFLCFISFIAMFAGVIFAPEFMTEHVDWFVIGFFAFTFVIVIYDNINVKRRKQVAMEKCHESSLFMSEMIKVSRHRKDGPDKFSIWFRDENGRPYSHSIPQSEYYRIRRSSPPVTHVVVLKYPHFKKNRYSYKAFDANAFVNESSVR